METINVWGLNFNPSTKNDIASQVLQWLDEGRKSIHLTGVNPETVVLAQTIPLLRDAINDSDIVNIDGIMTVRALRYYGYKVPERVASPDLFKILLDEANRNKRSVYLLGAEECVLKKMLERIRFQYPNLCISGSHNGYFDAEEEKRIVAEISTLAPDYLFLGLPSPMKENLIMKYKLFFNVRCCFGVGGVFDIMGGKATRAPIFIQKMGLEWLHRILQNPIQHSRRCISHFPKFIKLVLMQKKQFCINQLKLKSSQ